MVASRGVFTLTGADAILSRTFFLGIGNLTTTNTYRLIDANTYNMEDVVTYNLVDVDTPEHLERNAQGPHICGKPNPKIRRSH